MEKSCSNCKYQDNCRYSLDKKDCIRNNTCEANKGLFKNFKPIKQKRK